MPPLRNDLLIRALLKKPVPRTPLWIMRQAGRYLPLCKTPELACEVTVQPVERFDLDAAILFSDILTIPDAMGLGLSFSEGEGPQFSRPVTCMKDVERIARTRPMDDLGYVCDAVHMVRRELDGRVPLIGFTGSPWTLATYMVEGETSREFRKIKSLLYTHPEVLERLLEILSQVAADYLAAQIHAGAQAVMVFDTWGGVLSREAYLKYSLHPMQHMVSQLLRLETPNTVPVMLFTKGVGHQLVDLAATGCHAIGLDWTTELDQARSQVGSRVALQGNLDPAVLYAPDSVIQGEVQKVLEKYGQGSGHVFNLGHGIQQYVDPEKVTVLVDAVKEFSPAFH